MNNQKKIFIYIITILALILVFLPFVNTFNDVLTRIVIYFDYFGIIQNYIIPWEVRMVGVVINFIGVEASVSGEYLQIGINKPLLVEIAWNCIGWQSLLFFILTSWIGLQGNQYSFLSKLKAWSIGLLGTFLVNLIRIVMVVLISYQFGQGVGAIFHDYGCTLIVVLWLLFFWWFSYSYVLENL